MARGELTVFQCKDYRVFLRNALKKGSSPRGEQGRLAAFLKCQSSFLSQVLSESSHLSLEHGIKICHFFNFNESEKKFFMLLLLKGRSGSVELSRYYDEELAEILRHREETENVADVSAVIDVKQKIKEDVNAQYYSYWWNLAIHILSSIPSCNNRKAIAERLSLPIEIVNEAVEFLASANLIRIGDNGHLGIGIGRVHLDSKSHLVTRHHINWRIKSIASIEKKIPQSLHFSGVVGITKSDYKKIRNLLLETLKSTEDILVNSTPEDVYFLGLDLYQL